jgi:hypothetical protein
MLKFSLLAITVPGLTKDVLLPSFSVELVKFSVPLFVITPWVAVQSKILLAAKVTVHPDAIVKDEPYEKVEVPLIVAIPVPLKVRTVEKLLGWAMLRPPVIARVGVVPVKFIVIPATP